MKTSKKTKRSAGRAAKRTGARTAPLKVVVERVTMSAEIEALLVYITAGGSTLRLTYRLPEKTFGIFLEDLCAAVGLDATREATRLRSVGRALVELGRLDLPAVHVMRLADLQTWLSEANTMTGADRRTLAVYLRELNDGIWAALAKVKTSGRRLKWCEIGSDGGDDPDGPYFSEEQVAADFGVPPWVVRQAAWRKGVYGKKGYGKWA